jgi:hypothetical protein
MDSGSPRPWSEISDEEWIKNSDLYIAAQEENQERDILRLADLIEEAGLESLDKIMDILEGDRLMFSPVVPYKLAPLIRALALIGMEEVGSVLMKRKLRIINGEE